MEIFITQFSSILELFFIIFMSKKELYEKEKNLVYEKQEIF